MLSGLLVGLLVGLGGVALGLSPIGTAFETGVGLPWLFSMRGAIAPPKDVVVVAIDGRTGKGIGLPSSPQEWPRSVHARLVEGLVERGASVIVFDVLFDKPKAPGDDQDFAEAVARAKRVVLAVKLTGKAQPVADTDGVQRGTVWVEERVLPLPALVRSARGLAPFPLPKLEGAVSEFWAFKDGAGYLLMMPAMALQIHALSAYSDWRRLMDRMVFTGLERLPPTADELTGPARIRNLVTTMRRLFKRDPGSGEVMARLIEQDEALRRFPERRRLLKALARLYEGDPHRYLNFYGPPGTIATIPYHAVIKGGDPNLPAGALDFKDKVVFVGFSDLFDPGQPDRFYTVFTRGDGVDLSGVEIAATAFGNLLTDRTLKSLGVIETAMTLMLFGTLVSAIVYLLPVLAGIPASMMFVALYGFLAHSTFGADDRWLPVAVPILAQFPAALLFGLIAQYLWVERRRGKHISGAIDDYLPENVGSAPIPREMRTCPTCSREFMMSQRLCPHDGSVLEDKPRTEEWLVGQTLAGKYKIEGSLGQGGMGAVYRATHVMLGKPIALKLIRPEIITSPEVVRRFQREARAASLLSHPNIVTTHDLGQTEDGTLYIAMELCAGMSLKDLIVAEGPLDPRRAARLCRAIAGALALAHKHGIVHRDLKPQNVMITRDAEGHETPKVLDFGIAKAAESDGATPLTAIGMVLGTPRYLSPEQAKGLSVDGRSDLYSLGIIFYEMLVGRVPFDDPEVPTLLVKHMAEAPRPPSALRPDVPPAIEAIVLRLLEKDPARRFQSAEDLSAVLAAMEPAAPDRNAPTLPATTIPTPVHLASNALAGEATISDERPIDNEPIEKASTEYSL